MQPQALSKPAYQQFLRLLIMYHTQTYCNEHRMGRYFRGFMFQLPHVMKEDVITTLEWWSVTCYMRTPILYVCTRYRDTV